MCQKAKAALACSHCCCCLQRVAAHAASAVLLLQPEPCSSETAAEALKATTLISLRCLQLTAAPSSWSFNTTLSPIHWVNTAWQHIANLHKRCLTGSSAGGGSRVGSISTSSTPESGAHGAAAGAMRVVVQVPQLPREDDLLGFLHSTTASVSRVEAARLLSQRMLDRCVGGTKLCCRTFSHCWLAGAARLQAHAAADCMRCALLYGDINL